MRFLTLGVLCRLFIALLLRAMGDKKRSKTSDRFLMVL